MSEITNEQIKELIKQRRSQMLIHSCIYYQMDTNVVSDDTWQKWANELAELQEKYPSCCKIKWFDRHFYGWDGTSGAFLPLKDTWVWNKAAEILALHEKMGNQVDNTPDVPRKPTKKEVFDDLFE